MTLQRSLILFLIIFISKIALSQNIKYEPNIYPSVYKSTEESLNKHNKAPEWFKDAKLGIYFHWGLYSVPAFQTEWYAKWMHTPDAPKWGAGSFEYHSKTFGDPSKFGYHHFKPMFKAEKYDPDEWIKIFKSAGAKFTGPVVQHHDGFAMWQSKVNPNNAFDEGPKRDLAGEFLNKAHKEGLKTIATFHHSATMMIFDKKGKQKDGYFPYNKNYFTSTTDPKLKWMYGNVPKSDYLPYWENLVYEVVDKYKPDMIWFDSALARIPEKNVMNVFAHHFNAGAANKQEVLTFTKENWRLQDIRVYDQEQGGLKEMPKDYWMTDITLSDKGWCNVQNQTYKSMDLLIRNMIDVWSKRGIVLLNVSPTAAGEINKEQRNRLENLGNWMDTFGESVYNTRSHAIYGYGDAAFVKGTHAELAATVSYTEHDIRFTRSKNGKFVYVFLLGQPKEGLELNIKHVMDGISGKKIKNVSLLGSKQKIKWKYKEALKIIAPKASSANEIATVFKICLSNK